MKKNSVWDKYAHIPDSFKKTLLIMKLSLLLSITISLQISASVSSQQIDLGRNIKGQTVRSVLRLIEENSDIRFFYNDEYRQLNEIVQANLSRGIVEEIISTVLEEADLTYKVVENNFVVVFPSEAPQQIRLTGIVTDATTGEKLTGVYILIEGTNQGVITDANGNYSIELPPLNSVLIFSYIGYVTERIEMTGQSTINVKLVPDIKSLEEVVVIGYGTASKKDITGSVSTVTVKDAQSVSNVSVNNMIQGRTSGVNVSLRTAQPGGRMNIDIRGATSPNGSNSPLFVIDGVPISSIASNDQSLIGPLGFSGGVDRDPLSAINPSDIESISILKDASATAIYGSAAANGVVLVTTKKGKAGNVSVSYTGTYAFQKAKPYYPTLNATEFEQQANRLNMERYLYDNNMAPYSTVVADISGWTPLFTPTDIANAGSGTDWFSLITRNGSVQEHNISVTGGTEKVKSFASFNYYNNKGLLKNSDYTRYAARFNVDYVATRWLNVGSIFSFTNSGANNASTSRSSGGAEKFNEILSAMQFPPNVPYDPATFDIGTHSPYDAQLSNPVSFLSVKDHSTTSRFFTAPNLEISIRPNLKLKFQAGVDASNIERYVYYPVTIHNTQAPKGLSNNGLNKNLSVSAEEYLNYDAKIGANQSLNLVLGVGYYKFSTTGFGVAAQGFFTDAFGYDNIGIATDLANVNYNSFKNENVKFSQFARLNYNLNDKYILTLTARRDGSRTFAKGKKYGIFPGIAFAWKVGEEQFVKNLGFISDLKLRFGYGTTGNESMVGNFALSLYRSQYPVTLGGQIVNGVALTQVGNSDITWETNIMTNVGLDFGFLDNRFRGTLDFYNRTTRDLLDYDILPYNGALKQIASNVGSTKAIGFDFNLTSAIINGKFKWTNSFNVSMVNVNWKTRNPKQPLNPWQKSTDNLYAIFGWKTDGLIKSLTDIPEYMPNATVGNIKYVDINEDGMLDEKDVVNLGVSVSPWNLGMYNSFSFKNFDLSVFIYAKLGGKRFDGYYGDLTDHRFTQYYSWTRVGAQGALNSGLTTVKEIWTSDNPDGIHPGVADDRYTSSNPASCIINGGVATQVNDFYLQDASFLRIKNTTFGYQLPDVLLEKTGFIKSWRLYVDIDNIAVFTKWKGLDPEVLELNPYPTALTTSFGINVNF